jgi:class 3 adenylate cyclase
LTEAENTIQKIFYNDLANDLRSQMRKAFKAGNTDILLFNRSERKFYYLRSGARFSDIRKGELLEKYANEHYYKNESLGFTDEGGHGVGLALISTQIGALGYIVVNKMYGFPIIDKAKDEWVPRQSDINILDNYGALFGALALKNFQDIVRNIYGFDKSILSGRSKAPDNLHESINNYIPFGNNPCISVFLDIRGFSKLIQDQQGTNNKLYVLFIQDFSKKVELISREHFGIVSCHFGGGMLITFNHVIYEDRHSESCFRAICTMLKVREAFKSLLEEYFNNEENANYKDYINMGIGTSTGQAFFSTFGFSPCIYYTGIGEEIGYAKKLENISGRNKSLIKHSSPSSNGEILVSSYVYDACNEFKKKSVNFECINNVSYPYSKRKFTIYHVTGVNSKNCPLKYKCPNCKTGGKPKSEVIS